MIIKIYLTLLFLILDFVFSYFNYKTLKTNWVKIICAIIIIFFSWFLNHKYAIISEHRFRLLLIFSISILLIGQFSKLMQANLRSTLNRINEEKNLQGFVRFYRNIRPIMIYIIFPVLIYLGQLVMLWDQ